MIIDSLENSARYEQLNPYFKEAFAHLKSLDLNLVNEGKTVLKEDALTVSISISRLKSKNDAKLEAHNQYIDIQLPVSRPESFGWKERSKCTDIKTPFNTEKDIEFYNDIPATYFTLHPGQFVIFFPEDSHAPCVGEGEVKKIVIKVLH